jgi:hypothetical protein
MPRTSRKKKRRGKAGERKIQRSGIMGSKSTATKTILPSVLPSMIKSAVGVGKR